MQLRQVNYLRALGGRPSNVNGVNCWKPQRVMSAAISSQAKDVAKARALEGSETRLRAKAVMSPRAPHVSQRRRYSPILRGNAEVGLNSQHKTLVNKTAGTKVCGPQLSN